MKLEQEDAAPTTHEESIVLVPALPEHRPEHENSTTANRDGNAEEDGPTSHNTSKTNKKVCRNDTICLPCISIRHRAETCWTVCGSKIKLLLKIVVLILFLVYIGLAFHHHFGDKHSVRLVVVAVCVVCVVVWKWCERVTCVQQGLKGVSRCCIRPCHRLYLRHSAAIDACAIILVIACVLTFLVMDVALRRPASLVSAAGIAVFLTFMFLASHNPRQVVWRPVCWGLLLQFVFALLVLRTEWGRTFFHGLAAGMTEYMDHTNKGAEFVFGSNFHEHFFAFRLMPVLIFFSATIAILYYLGVVQFVIRIIANVMSVTMATGALETFHSAVNIFCGWSETLMIIRPFMETMTLSELHAVMTNGFATVAGGAIIAYVLYGVSANHLISASFMSAPAALAMSKLFYPSDQGSLKRKINLKEIPTQGTGVVDAASLGAVAATAVVAHIVVTVIAFISLLSFVNDTLEWLGDRVGLTPPHYPPLSFQLICSYLLWPVVFLLGVPVQDCRVVARLLGVKIFINEFIAYSDLGNVRANRFALESHVANNGTWRLVDPEDRIELLGTNTTLVGGVISPRSEMVATYALCGFSDFVALGIMTTALSTVAPTRRNHILQVAPRALISGIMACLMTAAVSSMVADDENFM